MQTPRAWTPFSDWQVFPPHPAEGFVPFNESATRALIWRELLQLADVPKAGRALFSGSLVRRSRLWKEFGSFIRQAKAYDDAASLVNGPSSALLQYYTALNLAKAELLTLPNNPKAFAHGLTSSSQSARSIAGDVVTVKPGVFPLLYEKRTGVSLPTGTRLNVKRLLGSVPELGWELVTSKFAPSTTASLMHAAVTDGTTGWAVIAIDNPSVLLDSPSSSKVFLGAFEPVTPFPAVLPGVTFPYRFPPPSLPGSNREWRDVFGVSHRFGRGYQLFFESRWRLPVHPQEPGPHVATDDYAAISAETNKTLRGLIDLSYEEGADATVTPSHVKNRMMPMPAGLARYAAIFYLSSLVRYRPTQVDLANNPRQHWLMSAFADQSAIHMLQSMLSGITGKWHLYYSPGAFRL
jgi:YaaC-like protein